MEYRKLANIYSSVTSDRYSLVCETYTPAQIEKFVKYFNEMVPETQPDYIRTIVQRFSRLKDTKATELSAITRGYIQTPPESFRYSAFVRDTRKDDKDVYTHALNKLKNNPTDITLYTFSQLDDVVGSFEWPEDLKPFDQSRILPTEGYPAKVVYQDKANGITVFFAQDFEDSKNIKSWLQQQDDRKYTFCLAGGSGMYDSYRYGDGRDTVKSLYYVHDTSVASTSDNRVNVIQRGGNGLYYYTQAPNRGPDRFLTWDKIILEYNPRLELIKNHEAVFKFYPLSDTERQIWIQSRIRPEQFENLVRYRDKYNYIIIQNPTANNLQKNKRLLVKDFIKLPKQLQHLYISMRALPAYSPGEILTLLIIDLFHDSEIDSALKLLNSVEQSINNNVSNWLKPLAENPIIEQFCNKETRNYYSKLIYRNIRTLGGGPRDNDVAN